MLLRNLRLIDGTGAVQDGVDVRLAEGRFVEIGALEAGADEVIEFDGASAIPGLIDAHTHLSLSPEPDGMSLAGQQSYAYQAVRTAARAAALLRQGVTTARDVGGVGPDVIFAVRDAIREGRVPGPRIIAAGRWLTATGGHGYAIGVEVDGPQEVRKAVRQEIKHGADLIKFMVSGGVVGLGLGPNAVQFSEEEVQIGVVEAHGAGLTVVAHAHGEGSIRNAVRGGVTSVEHGTFMTEALAGEMVERGAYLTPTLAIITRILDHLDEAGLEGHTAERAVEIGEIQRKNVAMALRAGVPMLAGTDMGAPFAGPDTLHDELAELVGIGMTPMQALQAATLQPARAMQREDDFGSVRPGRRADLVVLEADPLADIRATRRIRCIMQDGVMVYDARADATR